MSVDALSALLRALSFVALFQAAGIVISVVLFSDLWSSSARSIRRLGQWSASAGLFFVAAHYSLEAGRIGGTFTSVLEPEYQALVLDSSMSSSFAAKFAGLLLIVVSITRSRRLAMSLAVLGAALAVLGFALVGHTTELPRGIGSAALVGHVSVAAFWFGGLLPLVISARRESSNIAALIAARFTRIATVVVPLLLVLGVLLTLMIVDDFGAFSQPYGQLLLAKFGLFSMLMILAALNKWKYGPAIATKEQAARGFRKAVSAEYVLIIMVLVITAVLTTFYSP